jgi:hypothetical protein
LGDPLLLRLVGFCSRSSRSRSHCRSRSGSWASSSSSSSFCPFLAKEFLLVRAQLLPLFFLKDRCRISPLKNSNNNKIGKKLHPSIFFLFFFHCHFLCYYIRGGAADRLVGVRVRRREKPWGRSELFHFHRRLFRYDLISFLLLLLMRERRDFAGAELLLWM